MTYKEQFQILRQRTADAYSCWLKAQNRLSTDDQGFSNQALWDDLDHCASDLQKAQNEFNKLCSTIQKGNFSQDDVFGEQQACA